MNTKIKYEDYIKSLKWKTKSDTFKSESSCLVCGSRDKLNVHHLNYINLGNETINDVTVLCRQHHIRVHHNSKGKINKTNYGWNRIKQMWRHQIKMNRLKNTPPTGRPSGESYARL